MVMQELTDLVVKYDLLRPVVVGLYTTGVAAGYLLGKGIYHKKKNSGSRESREEPKEDSRAG